MDGLKERAAGLVEDAGDAARATAGRGVDAAQELYSSARDTLSEYREAEDEGELVYIGVIALLALVLVLCVCSRIISCCCGKRKRGGKIAADGTYVRLERSRDDISAQVRLWFRCSFRWCWIQIPVPYISFACSEPAAPAAEDPKPETTSAAPDTTSPAPGSATVTEIVALTVKGEWRGPVHVFLTGVDALQPAWALPASTRVASPDGKLVSPNGAWTRLHASGGGGGAHTELTTLAFDEPVRLREGFGCRLAVQLEPRPPAQLDAEGTADYVGAGETTVRVYESDLLHNVRSPAALSAGDEDMPVRAPPSSCAAAPMATTPRSYEGSSEGMGPASAPSARGAAAGPWRYHDEQYTYAGGEQYTYSGGYEPWMGSAPNSSRTARMHHQCGVLSPTASPFARLGPRD